MSKKDNISKNEIIEMLLQKNEELMAVNYNLGDIVNKVMKMLSENEFEISLLKKELHDANSEAVAAHNLLSHIRAELD
jgi:regulator of replication initiation timing